jgi:hypothetical protein
MTLPEKLPDSYMHMLNDQQVTPMASGADAFEQLIVGVT